jgi:hypothetical protein
MMPLTIHKTRFTDTLSVARQSLEKCKCSIINVIETNTSCVSREMPIPCQFHVSKCEGER